MYRKQVRRRRAVLVALVVGCLVLLSLHFSEAEDGPLHTVQRAVSTVLGPVQDGASQALKPARDLAGWFSETFDARGENEELRSELAELREQVAAEASAVAENRQLRRLAALAEQPELAGLEPVGARVIGRSPTVWFSSVRVGAGSGDGVSVDDPVIAAGGLFGRVVDVAPGSSQVRMITDQRSAVAVRAMPDGPAGIVRPEVGDPEGLLLDFIEDELPVREGQLLVTAGWSDGDLASPFPYGIPVGRVVEAEPAEQAAFQRVHVRPFADLRDSDVLQVLTRGGGGT